MRDQYRNAIKKQREERRQNRLVKGGVNRKYKRKPLQAITKIPAEKRGRSYPQLVPLSKIPFRSRKYIKGKGGMSLVSGRKRGMEIDPIEEVAAKCAKSSEIPLPPSDEENSESDCEPCDE